MRGSFELTCVEKPLAYRWGFTYKFTRRNYPGMGDQLTPAG